MTTMLSLHPRSVAVERPTALRPAVYTAEECLTWRILFDRQTALLYRRAPAAFFEGLRALGLSREAPPDLGVLSERLRALTGWSVVPARGRISDEAYMAGLARRELPVATWLRARRDTEFLPGPDLFHDVFGHLPLLAAEPAYARLLTQVGQVAARQHACGVRAAPLLTRLLGAATEFGLLAVPGGGAPQVIGAALLSGAAELHRATAPAGPALADPNADVRRAFAVAEVLATPLVRAGYQAKYFVTESWEALAAGVAEVASHLGVPAAAAGPVPVAPVIPVAPVVLAAPIAPVACLAA